MFIIVGMKKLNLYIARQIVIGFLLVAFCLMSIIWLTQSLRFIELITNKGISLAVFVKMTSLLMPRIFTILALISSAALFLTGCRGSYIGMLVILAGTFLVSAKYLWQNYKIIYISIVGTCMTLITSAILLSASLRARVLSMFAMRQDSSNSFRFNVYQSSFNMFKENWLLGIGCGNRNFREIYGIYMRTGFDALSAYNIFLEIAVESGIFALIAFLGFIITTLHDGIKIILKATDSKQVIFLSAAVISICALMVHGLVDTVFFRPQLQFIFWTMVAVVSSENQKQLS